MAETVTKTRVESNRTDATKIVLLINGKEMHILWGAPSAEFPLGWSLGDGAFEIEVKITPQS